MWRVQLTLAKIRKAARELLTLDEIDPKRIFEGNALIRRMVRFGLLAENERKLDFVLGLTLQKFLERRLQTKVFKKNMARSIHHARVLIKQKHIKVGRQVVDVPSFHVRIDSERHIEFDPNSSLSGGKPGRVKRRNLLKGNKPDVEQEDED